MYRKIKKCTKCNGEKVIFTPGNNPFQGCYSPCTCISKIKEKAKVVHYHFSNRFKPKKLCKQNIANVVEQK